MNKEFKFESAENKIYLDFLQKSLQNFSSDCLVAEILRDSEKYPSRIQFYTEGFNFKNLRHYNQSQMVWVRGVLHDLRENPDILNGCMSETDFISNVAAPFFRAYYVNEYPDKVYEKKNLEEKIFN